MMHNFTADFRKGGNFLAESNISCDQALRQKVGFFTLLQKEEI